MVQRAHVHARPKEGHDLWVSRARRLDALCRSVVSLVALRAIFDSKARQNGSMLYALCRVVLCRVVLLVSSLYHIHAICCDGASGPVCPLYPCRWLPLALPAATGTSRKRGPGSSTAPCTMSYGDSCPMAPAHPTAPWYAPRSTPLHSSQQFPFPRSSCIALTRIAGSQARAALPQPSPPTHTQTSIMA